MRIPNYTSTTSVGSSRQSSETSSAASERSEEESSSSSGNIDDYNHHMEEQQIETAMRQPVAPAHPQQTANTQVRPGILKNKMSNYQQQLLSTDHAAAQEPSPPTAAPPRPSPPPPPLPAPSSPSANVPVAKGSVKSRAAAYMATLQSNAPPHPSVSPTRTWQKPVVATPTTIMNDARQAVSLPNINLQSPKPTLTSSSNTQMSPLQARFYQETSSQHSSLTHSKDPLLELVSIDDTNTFYEDKEEDEDDDEEEVSYERSHSHFDSDEEDDDHADVSYDDSFVEETIGEDEYESVEETIVEESDTEVDSRLSTPPGSAYGSLLQSSRHDADDYEDDESEEEEVEEESEPSEESESQSASAETGSGSRSIDEDYSGHEDERLSEPKSALDLEGASIDPSSSHHYDPETPLVTNKSRLDREHEHEQAFLSSPTNSQKQSPRGKLSPGNLLRRASKNAGYQDLPSAPMSDEGDKREDTISVSTYEPPPTMLRSPSGKKSQAKLPPKSQQRVKAVPFKKAGKPIEGSGRVHTAAAVSEGARTYSKSNLDKSRQLNESFWRDRRVLALLCFVLLLIIAGVVGLVLWLVKGRENESNDSSYPVPVPAPTVFPARKPVSPRLPTLQPNATSPTPTVTPFVSGDAILAFRNSLPAYTISALDNDSFSPQSQAFAWSTSESQFQSLPLDRQQLRFALATLYYSTSGDSWTNNAFWLSSVNECFWWTDGAASCQGTQFAVLELVDNNLNGVLPLELGMLSGLTSLAIERNVGLVGSIPTTIASLSDLQSLALRGNGLVGSIPATLTGLSFLASMDLSENALTGSIVSELASMTTLSSLYLSQNRLTGSLPMSLGALSSLRYLCLDGNALVGLVPDSLSNLTSLLKLQLQDNDLSGTLARDMFSNIGGGSLITFNVGNNSLAGSIPPTIGRLGDVRYVIMSNNGLTGTLPTTLGRLQFSKLLDVGNNLLSGSIPSELALMTSLKSLVLSGNGFTGSVPSELCNLIQLNDLLISIDCDGVTCSCGCMCYVAAT
ncbi:hypothetical protein MPSEU_000772400 [Mayamaea pseudoterrestris]|nr:hypothetical protein MPSEU_000772400 [Mayamaea pseudoterrestris]